VGVVAQIFVGSASGLICVKVTVASWWAEALCASVLALDIGWLTQCVLGIIYLGKL
jgi:hypothetical protein